MPAQIGNLLRYLCTFLESIPVCGERGRPVERGVAGFRKGQTRTVSAVALPKRPSAPKTAPGRVHRAVVLNREPVYSKTEGIVVRASNPLDGILFQKSSVYPYRVSRPV